MGTKTAPGRFDCYAKAAPDEPLFVLLARDPAAPYLVSIWSSLRYGDVEAAAAKFAALIDRVGPGYALAPDCDKANEALETAFDMFAWRKAKGHAGRPEEPAHG